MKPATKTRILALSAALAAGAAFATPAYAYIDPGSGSMLVQLVVAAIAGGLFTIKVYWRRLKDRFGLGSKRDDGDGKPNPK